MTTELKQLADQLAPDYDAKRAMQDLQMMQLMIQTGRDELALTCVNRVNAYLYKLDQAAPRKAWAAVTIDNGSTLGLATENQRGYTPLAQIEQRSFIFERHADAQKLADQLNISKGLTLADAQQIVVSSMTA